LADRPHHRDAFIEGGERFGWLDQLLAVTRNPSRASPG